MRVVTTTKAHRQQTIYTACYANHPLPRYNANPLIRALSPLPSYADLQLGLTKLPEFDESERELDRNTKLLHLQQLFRIYVGLPRVVELMETMHSMICEGYMGRQPFTAEDHARRQSLYELQQGGAFFNTEDVEENGAEFTAALIGIPGIGKSQAIKRASRPYRKVIYHPELNIYQIPALLIEMPYKGVSVNALAQAIIRALDQAFPQGRYCETYLRSAVNAEVLFMEAVALMQAHYVGILLVDESQNKDYRTDARGSQRHAPSKATTGQTPLTTLLLTATNASQIPMLMSGTPELRDMLGARMSMLRRIVGRGMQVWKPLSLPSKEDPHGEFRVFLELIWRFQWTKTPFELTRPMHNIFYFYSQGITDVVIKLFHDIQLRAIRNGGDEIVDEDLVHDVAREELGALTEVTRAMRDMDYDKTGRIADLAAYLRIDPYKVGFQRGQTQENLQNAIEVEPTEVLPQVVSDSGEEAATTEPSEVPIGPQVARARRSRAKPRKTARPDLPPPNIEPIGDISEAFD
jgi:hypothetical protein